MVSVKLMNLFPWCTYLKMLTTCVLPVSDFPNWKLGTVHVSHGPDGYFVSYMAQEALRQVYAIIPQWLRLSEKLPSNILATKNILVVSHCGKKIEIWHSILRSKTQSHNDAASIRRVAKIIASSGFMVSFYETFARLYKRGEQQTELLDVGWQNSRIHSSAFQENCSKYQQSLQCKYMQNKLLCNTHGLLITKTVFDFC